eukprot:scaffold3159_cov393-Prasinococcus_capsulatus_cf.AAC.31
MVRRLGVVRLNSFSTCLASSRVGASTTQRGLRPRDIRRSIPRRAFTGALRVAGHGPWRAVDAKHGANTARTADTDCMLDSYRNTYGAAAQGGPSRRPESRRVQRA